MPTSVLGEIAHSQGRRDEVPNQLLAARLARTKNRSGIREIADHLADPDKAIQADCVKVLYEVGYLDPKLIAPFTSRFLELLDSRNNRMVWGAMMALTTVASLEADAIFAERARLLKAIADGSVITTDNGVKTVALVAAANPRYRKELFPWLLDHLRTTRAQDVPQHAEHTLAAVSRANHRAFIEVLELRLPGMKASRAARITRVIRAASRLE